MTLVVLMHLKARPQTTMLGTGVWSVAGAWLGARAWAGGWRDARMWLPLESEDCIGLRHVW